MLNSWDNINENEVIYFTTTFQTLFYRLNRFRYNNRYAQLLYLEELIKKYVAKLKKASPRFESGGDLKELSYN